jgi:NAD-specific glutamate dehydrogenase
LARATTWPLAAAGAVFFELGRRLGLDEAAMRAKAAPNAEHFDRLAILGLVEDVKQRQAALAARLIAFAGAAPTGPTAEWLPGLFATWSERNAAALDGYDRFLGEVDLASGVNVGKLALIDRKLADIALRLGA